MSDEEDWNSHLLLPLPLAELLHATLGPLANVLKEENHRWYPLIQRVLSAYLIGRDDQMTMVYGLAVLPEIQECTVQVAEELCRFVSELADQETDFQKWSEELDGNQD